MSRLSPVLIQKTGMYVFFSITIISKSDLLLMRKELDLLNLKLKNIELQTEKMELKETALEQLKPSFEKRFQVKD